MVGRTKNIDRRSYSSVVTALMKSHPKLARHLRVAEELRRNRLKRYANGLRLRGLEELLTHLEELELNFQKHKTLRLTSFLLLRAREAFVTSLEAVLSGYNTVAFDAMRFVMEIEFLFRDFRYNGHHLKDWLTCSEKDRYGRFRPAILRERNAKRLKKVTKDLSEAIDYKAHSRIVHVGPFKNPFSGTAGLSTPDFPFGEDAPFWDIFEHARRLLLQVHGFQRRHAPRITMPRGLKDDGLPKFKKAWEATQQMQGMAYALTKVAITSEVSES